MVLPPEVNKPTSPGRREERRVAEPVEGLVAGLGGVGVDPGEVDLVLAVGEIGDHVAAGVPAGLSLTLVK